MGTVTLSPLRLSVIVNDSSDNFSFTSLRRSYPLRGRALRCTVALLDNSPLRTVPQLAVARLSERVTFRSGIAGLP